MSGSALELVSAVDGFHLWSASYDRELTDVFAIQEQIATQVIDALRVSLLGAEAQRLRARPTRNLEAYEAYLRGMQQLARATWGRYDRRRPSSAARWCSTRSTRSPMLGLPKRM